MSEIQVADLTFSYEGSFDTIFENVSFSIDTNWKLGLIGRNGKGKTTFLNLLRKKYEYQGRIHTNTVFDYFPYSVTDRMQNESASEFMGVLKPGCEEWRVICELNQLNASAELLYRPFKTLSFGEQTKVLLSVLFAGENEFLLIDEPTNHLDAQARELVKHYLASKKGFILVSHDRDLLDACIDHVLVLNRKSIEVAKGNFTSWWENKQKKDQFATAENQKHLKEIKSLKNAAKRAERWADKNESSKIGFNPIKEHDRGKDARAYIGAKTKKMQARVKNYEKRMEWEIEEKEGLLQDIESPVELKLYPLQYHKERLIYAKDLSLKYSGTKTDNINTMENTAVDGFSMELLKGERLFLRGANGCGKSTVIKAVLGNENVLACKGELNVGSGLTISYINQDTSFLRGSLSEFCKKRDLDESLLFALLRQLDMERTQFYKNMEEYSEGQKKKVLIASSLLTPAHLYIWDEPLNYIDIFSRMQIEELLLRYKPTMLVVDHDTKFCEKIATRIIEMDSMVK